MNRGLQIGQALPVLLCIRPEGVTLEDLAEAVVASLPGSLTSSDPLVEGIESRHIQVTDATTAALFTCHEAGAFENLEVLHDRRQGHWQRLSELLDRLWPLPQSLDDLPSRGIGECLENRVYIRLLVKHGLNYEAS